MRFARAVAAVVVGASMLAVPVASSGAEGGPPPAQATPEAGAPSVNGASSAASHPGADRVALADGALRAAVADHRRGVAFGPDVEARGDRLLVEVLSSRPRSELEAAVASVGGTVNGAVEGHLVQALVPVDRLEELAARPGVDHVRTPADMDAPTDDFPGSGPVAGQQVAKSFADEWQALGHEGLGVKVGIIDTFDDYVWDPLQAAEELPEPAGTFCRRDGDSCSIWFGGDHGVRVAEVVHDMAPQAQLYIADVETTADLQAAVDWFQSQGVTVINQSSTGRFDGPGNGTGPAATVINGAISKGMLWVNSAGNSGGPSADFNGTSVGQYWRGAWSDPDGDGWINFTPTDEHLSFRCGYLKGLRWSDWGANPSDYDVYIYDDEVESKLLYVGKNRQGPGVPPLELTDANCSGDLALKIKLIAPGAGTAGDVFEFGTNLGAIEHWQNASSIAGPFTDVTTDGLLAVGAIGQDPLGTTAAPYSSQGPTNGGAIKPDISAPSCMRMALSNGCFSGTSSSSPTVAGAAALVRGAGLATTPASLASYLETRAAERGPTGPDNTYGVGELDLRVPPISTSCPGDDAYEPNDTAAQATLAPRNTYRPAALCDDDWYRIDAAAGQTIGARVHFNNSLGDLDLALVRASDGVPVAQSLGNGDTETVSYTAPSAGTYRLKVYGHLGATNRYVLGLRSSEICPPDDAYEPNDTRSAAADLGTESAIDGQVCIGNDDYYSIDVAPGEVVTATATFVHPTDAFYRDLDLVLYDPSGVAVDTSTGTTGTESVRHSSFEGGRYVIGVVGANRDAENSYHLVAGADHQCPADDPFEPNDTRSTASVWPGGPASVPAIVCSGDADWYGIEAVAGQSVEAIAQHDDDPGVDVAIFDPSGTQVATGTDEAPGIEFASTPVEVTGVYAVRVTPSVPRGSSRYDLTLSSPVCPPDPNEPNPLGSPTVVTPPTTVTGVLCGNDDAYGFDVGKGVLIEADLSFLARFGDIDLRLYAPSGTEVAASTGAGDGAHLAHRATETGRYQVLVDDVRGQRNTYALQLALRRATGTPDFDGDGDTDIAVYRPSTGRWYVNGVTGSTAFGASTDVPVPADYDGDGDTDIAVYRPSTGRWFVQGGSSTGTLHGGSGDVPVPADYDGDGDADIAVYRPSNGRWYVLGSTDGPQFGASTDVPVPADYDGDGTADFAVYRPSTGRWYVDGLAGSTAWGASGDVPAPGDYDGDGDADIAVLRRSSGRWYVVGGAVAGTPWGANGDVPVPGDYDGDGDTDIAVQRPGAGRWFVFGQPTVIFGNATDIPLSIPFAIRRSL